MGLVQLRAHSYPPCASIRCGSATGDEFRQQRLTPRSVRVTAKVWVRPDNCAPKIWKRSITSAIVDPSETLTWQVRRWACEIELLSSDLEKRGLRLVAIAGTAFFTFFACVSERTPQLRIGGNDLLLEPWSLERKVSERLKGPFPRRQTNHMVSLVVPYLLIFSLSAVGRGSSLDGDGGMEANLHVS